MEMSSSETRISTASDIIGEQAKEPAAEPTEQPGGEFRLGRLKRLDAANVWQGGDLTPWLRTSPEQLGGALRLEIRTGDEPPEGEAIGELTAGVPVVVKSRFESIAEGDVRDLAALVADLDAGVLVVLGAAIPDDLRQRLTKLNRNTTRAIVFYGVEIELWQIDDSAPAPRFRVVAGPDGWDRTPTQGDNTEGGSEDLSSARSEGTAAGSTSPGQQP
jgi:hypothetical protein